MSTNTFEISINDIKMSTSDMKTSYKMSANDFEMSESTSNATAIPEQCCYNVSESVLTDMFSWIALIMGVVGSLANLLVLVALSDKSLRRKSSNVLILWQVLFDLVSCICLVVTYAFDLVYGVTTYMERNVWNKILCMCFIGNGLVGMTENASVSFLGNNRVRKICPGGSLDQTSQSLQKVRIYFM